MKDAEKIARDCVRSQCGTDDLCAMLDEKSCGCTAAIATALRSAYSAGYAAAREQAAGVAEHQGLYVSNEEVGRANSRNIATKIRSMEPRDE